MFSNDPLLDAAFLLIALKVLGVLLILPYAIVATWLDARDERKRQQDTPNPH